MSDVKSKEIVQAVREIVNGQAPHCDISKILYEHGCFYLLSKLKEQTQYTKFATANIAVNTQVVKERYDACKGIFDKLKNTKYAVIKGAVLSQMAYGKVSYRKSGDIDLLICREDVDVVKRILLEDGFVQGKVVGDCIVPYTRQEILFHTSMTHQTAPFIKQVDSKFCKFVNIDVNMDILWGESRIHSDMGYILGHTQETQISGVTVKKLSPVMEFISLCLHHYKDMNSIYLLSQGSLRLSIFCDIYYYLVNSKLDCTELMSVCEKLQVDKYIYYCIYCTHSIFKDDIIVRYLSMIQKVKPKEYLQMLALADTFGLEDVERKYWSSTKELELQEDRLFCRNFAKAFYTLLDNKDIQKIEHNKKHML